VTVIRTSGIGGFLNPYTRLYRGGINIYLSIPEKEDVSSLHVNITTWRGAELPDPDLSHHPEVLLDDPDLQVHDLALEIYRDILPGQTVCQPDDVVIELPHVSIDGFRFHVRYRDPLKIVPDDL
jgi:hypothetical protein